MLTMGLERGYSLMILNILRLTVKISNTVALTIPETFQRSQDASGQGFAPPPPPRGEEKAQAEEACPASQLLLHGRQMPRLLQV